MPVKSPGLRPLPPERRGHERVSIAVGAELRMEAVATVHIVITDISETGFRCKVGTYVKPGPRVWLCLPKGEEVEANLVWYDGAYCGFVFLAPISAHQVKYILT